MVFLYLVVIFGTSFQSVCQKQYNKKAGGNGYIFSGLSALVAAIFFAATEKFKIGFTIPVLKYSFWFMLSYSVTLVCTIKSIKCGSMSLTALMIAYSLVIPTLYGLVFLNEQAKCSLYMGIVLLMLSLWLINKTDGQKPTLKWALCVIPAFVGNGLCAVIQKQQQLFFNGSFKSEFMVYALVMSAVLLITIGMIKGRNNPKRTLKNATLPASGCGVANGVVNYMVMVLMGIASTSVLFPVISAGSIVLTFFISLFIYKEKLSKMQLFGFFMGMISIIFLNI